MKCVREALDSKEECPQCRAKSSFGQITRNTALGDVIASYEQSRSRLLDLTKPAPSLITPERPHKRQRLTNFDDVEEVEISSSEQPRVSEKRKQSAGKPDVLQQTEGIVECPQCEELVDLRDINTHLDNNCAMPSNEPSKKPAEGKKAWQAIFNGRRPNSSSSRNRQSPPPTTRLPKEAYDLMKDKQLRERLSRFDISTTGSRARLQARHERWVILYNANLDNPVEARKPVSALREELSHWEEGKEQDEKEKTKAAESAGQAGDIEYQAKHRAQFQQLVHLARSNRENKGSQNGPESGSSPLDERIPSNG
ncbi:E3 ubiquitin-protein ligase rad18 [Tulasnella sp. 418]|nr:E3 ubiquitin-protein ligase rad18 [Tulasnella sp. 418]